MKNILDESLLIELRHFISKNQTFIDPGITTSILTQEEKENVEFFKKHKRTEDYINIPKESRPEKS